MNIKNAILFITITIMNPVLIILTGSRIPDSSVNFSISQIICRILQFPVFTICDLLLKDLTSTNDLLLYSCLIVNGVIWALGTTWLLKKLVA